MNNAKTVNLGALNAVQVTRFEKELREAIEKRKGKAPDVPQKEVERFVKDSVKLWLEPKCRQFTRLLERIRDKKLYLLSNVSMMQYAERLHPQSEDQLGEQSADPDAGTQADSAAGVHASDSPAVVQSDPVGPDVTTEDASERGTPENTEPNSRTDAPCPGNLVPDFSLDLLDDKAGTESRELKPDVVEDYVEGWTANANFDPILVYRDGDHYFLADGFHRVAAARKAGRTHVPADVRKGDRLAALEASLKSNHTHGSRRTAEDKIYAVDKALREFQGRSDRMVAEMCGVSPTFVGKRRELMPEPSTVHVDSSAKPAPKTRVGRDGRCRKLPGPKGGAQAKSTQKPQAEGQSPAETWKHSLRQLKDQVKALIPGVRQYRKLYPDEVKRLTPALDPLLDRLAKLLK
jgi:hypothetical protein